MARDYSKLFDEVYRCGDWIQIFSMFKNIYLSSFKWSNLPNSINTRFLNMTLFEQGRVVFFKDEDFGFLTLQVGGQINFDVYGEPSLVDAVGFNGYRVAGLKNNVECVIIYDNLTRITPANRLEVYAKRIAEIEMTVDINIGAQKTPFLIKTDKKGELTLKNVYKHYKNGQPVMFVDKSFNDDSFKVIQTQAPFIADKLHQQKKNIINEALAYLGVENNSSEKRERLTADEVLVSNGLAYANRNANIYSRKLGIDKINEIFELNIDVENQNLFLTAEGVEEDV